MKEDSKRRIGKIRNERDEMIWNGFLLFYGATTLGLLWWLSELERSGRDVLTVSIVGYGSLIVTVVVMMIEYENRYLSKVMCSVRSILALGVVLIVAMPFMVLLHGITGYKKYAMREARRIAQMEVSRWKEEC